MKSKNKKRKSNRNDSVVYKNKGAPSMAGPEQENALSQKQKIPSVNYHLWQPCNMRCGFCFAAFMDVKEAILPKGHLPKDQSLEVVRELAEAGFHKITFAGGEPTLCSWLSDLIALAKSFGMTTMIVTNGTGLSEEFLKLNRKNLDWIAISIDSLSEETNKQSGRAILGKKPLTETKYRELVTSVKDLGYGLKINTVVHRFNWKEDFSDFIQWAGPERWKVLQVLPMEGQNDKAIGNFEITDEEFNTFKNQHENLHSVADVVFEDVDSIRGSYVMVDPAGRFFDNTEGRHFYSSPILEVGCASAYNEMRYDGAKFIERGGVYEWERRRQPVRITLSGKVASGKSTVGKLLATQLGYGFQSLGNQVRKEAEIRGLTIGEFQDICLANPGMDQEIDKAFALECNQQDGLVIDYRLGFKFIINAFHIYLSIDDEVALERIGKAGRTGDNELTLAARNETFKLQFDQAYGLDYTDPNNYDLVVSCTPEKSLEMIVLEILQALPK